VSEATDSEERYLAGVLSAAREARRFLEWVEHAMEQLAPQRLSALAAEAETRFATPLADAARTLVLNPPPSVLTQFGERFAQGFDDTQKTLHLFVEAGRALPPESISHILGAMHHGARAQEAFYLLRTTLAPFVDYWPLPEGITDSMPQRDTASPTGVIHMTKGGHHGGFSWYVPEHYDPERAWPIVVALHGGSGNGRDFLWTWLREARQRGYILVAPNALNETWSEEDDQGLLQILSWLSQRYHLDRERILITGLSDGATFTLLYGLAHPRVYRALAPLCGVLHPANQAIGNLDRAADVPIYLVHGALDFLFPIAFARYARDTLTAAGAALTYRELAELSHTYPRSENERILDWFEDLPSRTP